MANIKSAKKRVLTAQRNHDKNVQVKSEIKTAMKKVLTLAKDGSAEFEIQADTVVSMNFFCFTRDYVDLCIRDLTPFLALKGTEMKSEFLVPIHVNELIKNNEIKVSILPSPCVWYGVTYKEDKDAVVKAFKELVEKGLYKKGLYQ